MPSLLRSPLRRHHNLLIDQEPITGPVVKSGGGRTAGKKVGRVVGGVAFGIVGTLSFASPGSGDHTLDFASLNPSEGDRLLVHVGQTYTGSPAFPTINTAGYSAVATPHTRENTNSAIWSRTGMVEKVLADGETSLSVNDGGQATTYILVLVRGGNATLLDVPVIKTDGINTDRANPGAITPATDGAIILAFGGGGYTTGGILTNPGDAYTDFAAITDVNPGTGFDHNAALGSHTWADGDGAYDPPAFLGGANQTNSAWTAWTIAIKPPA